MLECLSGALSACRFYSAVPHFLLLSSCVGPSRTFMRNMSDVRRFFRDRSGIIDDHMTDYIVVYFLWLLAHLVLHPVSSFLEIASCVPLACWG